MKERTCVLIKPDGIESKAAGKVISRFEQEGLDLRALKMIPPDASRLEKIYSVHKGKPFYDGFMAFMLSGPLIAAVWEGENVIARVRKIIGATNSKEAEAGTLRQLYGTDNRKNLVHASDSPDSAEREIRILFQENEIIKIKEASAI